VNLTIDWTTVSISFAVACLLFYCFQWLLALLRRNKARKKVKISEAKLRRFIGALKQRVKNDNVAGEKK